ncbi:MAG: flagellar basal body-associated FliL family protein [Robiginitomaculum sp.]|nr:flagellar basal body-associated FliL family protein [Robiginitomaculum sp.]
MARASKSKKQSKESPKASGSDAESTKGKKPGIMAKLILPVVLGVTSFCTVYFLPRDTPIQTSETAEHVSKSSDTDAVPEILATSFVTLEPFTVSIKGRSRILRLGITLEVPEKNAEAVDAHNPKLRDAFMGYLSVLDMAYVEDAAFLVGLRVQLTRRAKFVLGANNIQNVLITDFMVR